MAKTAVLVYNPSSGDFDDVTPLPPVADKNLPEANTRPLILNEDNLMKSQQITMTLEGITEDTLDSALGQVVAAIRNGFTSGGDRNDDGRYWFDVINKTIPITLACISTEAQTTASQLTQVSEADLLDFAMLPEGLNLDSFGGEHIGGNTASILQVMFDQVGVETVTEKLNRYFNLNQMTRAVSDGPHAGSMAGPSR